MLRSCLYGRVGVPQKKRAIRPACVHTTKTYQSAGAYSTRSLRVTSASSTRICTR
ncbi:MAG: hypothetical protein NWR72_08870 [Bacteroidia bacterium]|nr:hypothetical protein [Bacteroidia bacterium]